MLKQHQPNFDQMEAAEIAESTKWLREIAMLERRVESLYEEVDLGNGDKIAVRTALSEEESAEYAELEKKKRTEGITVEEVSEISYRQLELMTMNPLLTAGWFRQNKDKWPVNDALAIAVTFAENQLRIRQERLSNLEQFRRK